MHADRRLADSGLHVVTDREGGGFRHLLAETSAGGPQWNTPGWSMSEVAHLGGGRHTVGSRVGDAMVVRDLWVGADVRWQGPETVRKGVRLRPGERAVVVDAGRHHVSSFSSMYVIAGQRPPRPGRGVMIRLAGGDEVTVPRKHLEIVAPDHLLSAEPDGTQAAWWLEQLDRWGPHGVPVSSLVPSSFPAVCQVLHPWHGLGSDRISWREAAEQLGFDSVAALDRSREMGRIRAAEDAGLHASLGALDMLTATALVEVLAAATTTPDEVLVAVWEGWADVPVQRFPGAVHLDTYNRGHFLLRGPLTGVLSPVAVSGFDQPAAGLWWPADRAWFIATEIDFEWTFVAGDHPLMQRLLADPRLEVAPTTFAAAANRATEPS